MIAALADGSLLIFAKGDGAEADQAAAWQVVRAVRGFSRKAPLALLALDKRGLLLSLTDEGVNVHSLPELNLKCQACDQYEHG